MERQKIVEIFAKHPDWNQLMIHGLNDPSWMEFLIEIDSRDVYLKCIAYYLEFHHNQL